MSGIPPPGRFIPERREDIMSEGGAVEEEDDEPSSLDPPRGMAVHDDDDVGDDCDLVTKLRWLCRPRDRPVILG